MVTQPTTQPVRLALVGAGIFAKDAHLPSLLRLSEHFRLTAVYSRSEATAAQLAQSIPYPVRVYTDYAVLLADPEIDAVDLVLPITAMPPFVTQTLASGKHLISEKPIATDLATGRELLAAYQQRAHQVWMVAENWRYETAFVQAAALVQAGEIGTPITCHLAAYTPMQKSKYANSSWRQSGFNGGQLLDGGVHHIAALRLIVGELAQVSAVTRQVSTLMLPVDTMSAHLHFANGALGAYLVSYAVGAPWAPNLYVVGDQGSLRVLRGEIEITNQRGTQTLQCAKFDGVEKELLAFAEAIRQGKPHTNSPEAALQDLAVIEALLQSAASGQTIRVGE
jgi:predicted dehydrogenase